MTLALLFPAIDPVAVAIGPITIRWYALAYVLGLLLGWLYIRRLARRFDGVLDTHQVDDLLVWMTIGVVLGGRLGHVLFYKPAYYLANPIEVLYVWHGGMSFHGGLIGVALALILFARRRRVALLRVADLVACAAPIGLFFGRIANFINGELYGRASDLPWAMAFPRGGPITRHPSQIYEALLEGLLLFLVLFALSRLGSVSRRPGLLTGVFVAGYGLTRIVAELFRQPDANLGFIVGGVTMGQLLSAPMLALGIYLIVVARGEREPGGRA